ncbi:sugar isomerase domain-containing protein [Paramicrobacterium chengjingii]|uniref:sugar isomerase domain-containing protein n=1 Tax=Paramicrobacterium chengjingii TaxID=2769067 RepID=UPI001421242D|nr:SIS domain-containing protein [Microbacterium chengjingii]
MTVTPTDFLAEATTRLTQLAADAEAGGLDDAIALMVDAINAGGVVQAFGTGHSEAFAMEIAGRAGGLIPTNKIALRDVALYGSRSPQELVGSTLERETSVVDELFDVSLTGPNDVFIIASNSGVNGSIVGVALKAKELGHPVIAVTSLQHTAAVEPKHASGRRLSEIADVVIDNLAPYGDATLTLSEGVSAGAISSITAAFIAQLLTLGVAQKLSQLGDVPPMYISANIPGGDEHNHALEDLYRDRIRRSA